VREVRGGLLPGLLRGSRLAGRVHLLQPEAALSLPLAVHRLGEVEGEKKEGTGRPRGPVTVAQVAFMGAGQALGQEAGVSPSFR